MKYLMIAIVLVMLIPGAALANTATPTPTPTVAGDTYISTQQVFDLQPELQYDASFTHDDIVRDLGISDAFEVGVYAQSLDMTSKLNEQLGDSSAVLSTPRSSAWVSCSERSGSTPVAIAPPVGAAAVSEWTWSQYTECGGYRGPACAAQLQDITYYTMYYSDLGRGSWITIPYLWFSGAPAGVSAPPSAVYSSRPEWHAKLYFEDGSIREPEAGVIPTYRPEVQSPGQPYEYMSNIWNPREIGLVNDTNVSGRRYYITQLTANQVANFAVQIRMPRRLLNSFKPRISVCAVRPYQYSPAYAQTQVVLQTQVAATRTSVAGDVIVPPAPTRVTTNNTWNDKLIQMHTGARWYTQCLTNDLNQCFVEVYGSAGSTPTYVRTALRISVLDYDPSTKRVGSEVYSQNYVFARGAVSRIDYAQIAGYMLQSGKAFNRYRHLIQIQCPITGSNIICAPPSGPNWANQYECANGSCPNNRPMTTASNAYMIWSLAGYGGSQAGMTATAYKSQRTPTITQRVFTAVPTFTQRPTVVWPTLPPPPPTINATLQTGATQTAIVRQRQTATTAAGSTYGTQTAVAVIIAQATAAQATANAQSTAFRQTATAQTRATQTVQAVATVQLAATLTAISQQVGTQQATQEAGANRTATVAVLIDDGDAVIRFRTNEQLEQVEEVSNVGPGAVFDMLSNAFTAFDRGLYSTPCNGFPASLGGVSTTDGAYQITNDLAQSLCTIRQWLDSQTSVIPLVRQILSVVFVLLIAIMVLRIIRGSSK